MKIYPFPTPSTKADAVILANGEFPSHIIPSTILADNKYIVCCDGAINKLSETTIKPNAIVGDCDSLSAENIEKYKNIIYRSEEQETNDLTKSVRFSLEHDKKDIIILGATGKREDHTIANISLLADYIDYTDNICMITDYGIFNAISTTSIFKSFIGQQVSIFCIQPTGISAFNLKYPVRNKIFTNWWQATLNESQSTSFTIETKGKVIVFRAF